MEKMTKEKTVTIRIKIADYELEVQGRQSWAEKTVKEFIKRVKKENEQSKARKTNMPKLLT